MPYGSGGDYDGNEPMTSGNPPETSIAGIIGGIILGICLLAIAGFVLALAVAAFGWIGIPIALAAIWLFFKF